MLTEAETIALNALAFLSSEPDRLRALCEATGLSPRDLASRATDPEVLVGVLDAVLSDDSTLLVFCADFGLNPERVLPARYILEGPQEEAP